MIALQGIEYSWRENYKEEFYGKELILADRDMVETESDEILRDADKEDVALLVVGDPFGWAHPILSHAFYQSNSTKSNHAYRYHHPRTIVEDPRPGCS